VSKILSTWSGKVGALAVLVGLAAAWQWSPNLYWKDATVTWLVPVVLVLWGAGRLADRADTGC